MTKHCVPMIVALLPAAAAGVPEPGGYLTDLRENHETLAFDYETTVHETGTVLEGTFFIRRDDAGSWFQTTNANGEVIELVQLLTGDDTHFIDHRKEMVYSFQGPGNSLIFDRMLEYTRNGPSRIIPADGAATFVYETPFPHDENILLGYHFLMQEDQGLVEMKCFFDGRLTETVTFSPIRNGVVSDQCFHIPEDYSVETFGFSYDPERMPPWWAPEGD